MRRGGGTGSGMLLHQGRSQSRRRNGRDAEEGCARAPVHRCTDALIYDAPTHAVMRACIGAFSTLYDECMSVVHEIGDRRGRGEIVTKKGRLSKHGPLRCTAQLDRVRATTMDDVQG